MVVAQLVERAVSIPKVRGSNSVISKSLLILNVCLLSTVYCKNENKEKEVGNDPFFKVINWLQYNYHHYYIIIKSKFLNFFG